MIRTCVSPMSCAKFGSHHRGRDNSCTQRSSGAAFVARRERADRDLASRPMYSSSVWDSTLTAWRIAMSSSANFVNIW